MSENEDYEPFGKEWKAEMMKLTKVEILEAYASVGRENIVLRHEILFPGSIGTIEE